MERLRRVIEQVIGISRPIFYDCDELRSVSYAISLQFLLLAFYCVILVVWSLHCSFSRANKKGSRQLHIVLDNAGPELMGDLIFAEYLMQTKLVDKTVLHGKVCSILVTI